jgi:acetyl/propionyl-CoA carboxylase alpha subunit
MMLKKKILENNRLILIKKIQKYIRDRTANNYFIYKNKKTKNKKQKTKKTAMSSQQASAQQASAQRANAQQANPQPNQQQGWVRRSTRPTTYHSNYAKMKNKDNKVKHSLEGVRGNPNFYNHGT